jgi:hypothetical protein
VSAARVCGAAVTTAWILVGVAGLLIVGNGVFVAAETGLVMIDCNLVESRAREGDGRFGRVVATLRRLSTYLSGLNFCSLQPLAGVERLRRFRVPGPYRNMILNP